MAQVALALGMLVLLAVGVRSRPERTLSSADPHQLADTIPPAETVASDDEPSSSTTHSSADSTHASRSSDSPPDASSGSSSLEGGTDVPSVSSSTDTPADLDISPVKDVFSTSVSPSNRSFELKGINGSLVEPTLSVISSFAEIDTAAFLSNYSYDPSFEPSFWEKDPVQFRRFLIEDLKRKILHGLKLADAPTEIFDTEFSDDVIKILNEEEKEISRSDQKENLVVHAINDDYTCSQSNGEFCRRFEFSITADLDSIISAHAWFHKTTPARRLVLSAYSSQMDESLVILKEALNKTTKSEPSWSTFELPKTLVFESEDDSLLCAVEIEGADIDTEGDKAPFLVITKHTEVLDNKKREKRSVAPEQTNSSACTCKAEDFNVTVDEIGFQKWIHKPKDFNIKMCKGTCKENLGSATVQYHHVISMFYKLNPDYPKPECNFWAPRCQPDSYLPLRMMYKSKNGTLHDTEIPDMIVDTCSCK